MDPSLHHILPNFTTNVVKRESVKLVGFGLTMYGTELFRRC